jgi:hypothetical protein
MDGKGDVSDSDPVNRLDAKVQAVVALFAPADLGLMFNTMSRPGTLTALMGFAYQDPATGPPGVARPDDWENRQYRSASPITHVSADDAPIIRVPGGKHGPNFLLPAGDPRVPDHVGEAVRWFNTHLTGRRTSLHSTSSVRLRAPALR